MGAPDGKSASAFDTLDTLLNRLAEFVTGQHPPATEHAPADTVEEAVRRIEDQLPSEAPPRR